MEGWITNEKSADRVSLLSWVYWISRFVSADLASSKPSFLYPVGMNYSLLLAGGLTSTVKRGDFYLLYLYDLAHNSVNIGRSIGFYAHLR